LLHKVTTPTLVFHARGDQMVPHRCGREISEGIPGARFITLESTNHLLLAHEPAFVRLLDEVRLFTETERQPSEPAKTSDIDVGRKSVTVLSVEIVSPLHAFASVDPELVLRQIDPLLESTFEIVELNGGVILASGEAGVTAVFGILPASRHHAASACAAARVGTRRVVLAANVRVRVRGARDTGEVIVRGRGHGATKRMEVTGGAVRGATRLARSLRRGAVAITVRTRVAADGLLNVVQLSRSDLIRFGRDEQAYELKSVSSTK